MSKAELIRNVIRSVSDLKPEDRQAIINLGAIIEGDFRQGYMRTARLDSEELAHTLVVLEKILTGSDDPRK